MADPAEGIGPRTRGVGYAVTNAGETTQLATDALQGVVLAVKSRANRMHALSLALVIVHVSFA